MKIKTYNWLLIEQYKFNYISHKNVWFVLFCLKKKIKRRNNYVSRYARVICWTLFCKSNSFADIKLFLFSLLDSHNKVKFVIFSSNINSLQYYPGGRKQYFTAYESTLFWTLDIIWNWSKIFMHLMIPS